MLCLEGSNKIMDTKHDIIRDLGAEFLARDNRKQEIQRMTRQKLLQELKTQTQALESISKQPNSSENFDKLIAKQTELFSRQEKYLTKEFNALKKKELNTKGVEKKIESLISEIKKKKPVIVENKEIKIDLSKLEKAIKESPKEIAKGFSQVGKKDSPFYVVPVDEEGNILYPKSGSSRIAGYRTVNLSNIAGNEINPSTLEKQDEIISAIGNINGGGGSAITPKVSTINTLEDTILPGATLSGSFEKTDNNPDAQFWIVSDQDVTLFIEFSPDGVYIDQFPFGGIQINAGIPYYDQVVVGEQQFRIRIENTSGSSANVQTFVSYGSYRRPSSIISTGISAQSGSINTKAVLFAKDSNGNYVEVLGTEDGSISTTSDSSIINFRYDAYKKVSVDSTTDRFEYYQGGLLGTKVAEVEIVYETTSKQEVVSAERTNT